MATDEACRLLYALCYTQTLTGDVAEIRCWQGKSTTYLARAVQDTQNGILHVVDTFRGNPGKEKHYRVRRKDLGDLKANFVANMESLGLTDSIRLHATESVTATSEIADRSLRFVFIDGNHESDAIRGDIAAYLPKLKAGGWIIFDDYSPAFASVVEAVHDLITSTPGCHGFSVPGLFVLQPQPETPVDDTGRAEPTGGIVAT